jgi:hypothetical protein
VDSVDALAQEMTRVLADEALRVRMGEYGREMVLRNRGAVERTIAMLDPWLSELGARP